MPLRLYMIGASFDPFIDLVGVISCSPYWGLTPCPSGAGCLVFLRVFSGYHGFSAGLGVDPTELKIHGIWLYVTSKPSLEVCDIPVAKYFPDVYPDEIPSFPPRRENSSSSSPMAEFCGQCGGKHPTTQCVGVQGACNNCGQYGHFARVCPLAGSQHAAAPPQGRSGGSSRDRSFPALQ
ncbi:hypothetical protein F511_43193 [Dorcoceras hygrometricum]|uniref:CCHC-type domain-containing protein n=1 Tax=Dorcoceras hygrometricum TaxID=472368 RepID=A0A2Z7BYK8_9LAMI|nr:hypothetical protein F511_43193 [Dorcoceras hygrometricum]